MESYRQPSKRKGDHAPLIVEACTSMAIAGYLLYLVYTASISFLPLLPLTILLLCVVTLSFHFAVTNVSLARQGIVQGHCLVPTLAALGEKANAEADVAASANKTTFFMTNILFIIIILIVFVLEKPSSVDA